MNTLLVSLACAFVAGAVVAILERAHRSREAQLQPNWTLGRLRKLLGTEKEEAA